MSIRALNSKSVNYDYIYIYRYIDMLYFRSFQENHLLITLFCKFFIFSILGYWVLCSGTLNSYFSYTLAFSFLSKLSTSSSFTCISYFQLEGDILECDFSIFPWTMRTYECWEMVFLSLWPFDHLYHYDLLGHLQYRCLGFTPDLLILSLRNEAQ